MNNNLLASSEYLTNEVVIANTLVVFDDRVSNINILTQALLPGSIGFTIDSQADAILAITQLLATTGARYLAIVAHGEPGVVHLGEYPLDLNQLQARSHLLQQWDVKAIALYSCEVAQGDIGQNLIYQLSELTGATVAASVTKTGSAALGGSWYLTVTTGEIVAPELFEAAILKTYGFVLPIVTVGVGTTPVEGGSISGTFVVNLSSPAPTGGLRVYFITAGTATLDLDYTLTAGTNVTSISNSIFIAIPSFVIAAGKTSATLNVTALTDNFIDPNETVILKIGTDFTASNSSPNYTLGDFVPRTDFAVGDAPYSVSVGDFNGDGKLDLATANSNSRTASVLLGNGAGGFAPKNDFAVGTAPQSVSVGDFNGDGRLDLVTANYSSSTVSVLLGNISGGFTPKTDFAVGLGATSVSVGDFNGDGKLDLVTANATSRDVSVLLGNGSGGFAPKTDFAAAGIPTSVSVGDFNGDGKLDLVTANYFNDNDGALLQNNSSVSVLLGNGSGSFAPKTDFALGLGRTSVSVGDFNGDGKLDLVTANYGSDNVSVLLGNGSGSFAPKTDFAAGTNPYSVSVGDFNGDGKLDLVTANVLSDNVSVLLNNYPYASLNITDTTQYPRRNDFNGDTVSDILWRNDNGAVALWQMFSGIVLTNKIVASLPSSWKTAGTGDFNGDKKADIVWRNDNGAISLWQMNGSTVTANNIVASLSSDWKASGTGDFGGDGKADLVWRNDNGAIALWQMNGSTVSANNIVASLPSSWKSAGTADFGGDNKADLLWRNDNGAIAMWQMNGATVVSNKIVASLSSDWKDAGVGDFNGDGKSDLLWRNDNGAVAMWQMDGSTVISSKIVDTLSNDWKSAGIGDFNADGKADILWRNDNSANALWQMNGSTVSDSLLIPSLDPTWKIATPII
jgi:Domain of unknown function (DUF4347)/FG-GAP-like repeat/FG-GAP repeat